MEPIAPSGILHRNAKPEPRAVKSIVLLPFSLALGVAGVVSGVYATSLLLTDYTPHRFAHMDAPLWTDRPMAIDRTTQTLERLPAMVASADIPAQGPFGAETVASSALPGMPQQTAMQTGVLPTETASSETALNTAHVDWCFARYRSYRIEDNSYQPFDTAARIECQSPYAAGADVQTVADDGNLDDVVIAAGEGVPEAQPQIMAASDGVDTAWCFAQYRSYRAEDNSYQPFDGGSRRQCVPRPASY